MGKRWSPVQEMKCSFQETKSREEFGGRDVLEAALLPVGWGGGNLKTGKWFCFLIVETTEALKKSLKGNN